MRAKIAFPLVLGMCLAFMSGQQVYAQTSPPPASTTSNVVSPDALTQPAFENPASVRITEIKIEGNRRVSDGTVQAYLPIRVGDLTSPNALSNALERLYATNLFQDISLDIHGSVLLVSIQENPIINRVNIEGNDVLSDENLLAAIDVQPRRVYNRGVAIEATQELINIYRSSGRFAAVVEPKIIKLDENRVDLVFEVDEGPLIKIDSIAFSGNQAFSDRKLRQAIASRETRWWAFLSATDKYDEGRLDYDVRLLRQFYLARGYADIKIDRVRGGLLPDRSGFAITFIITEGVRYQVENIALSSGIEGVDIEALKQQIDFGDERWYDVRLLEQGLLDISKSLGSLGYAFVNVVPEIETDATTGQLNISITIDKARRNFVERIEFVENTRTMDSVIRREFEIVEGDAYNQLQLDRSVRNVRNLGFFSDVKVKTIQGSSADQSITRVLVKEQSTGSFSVGVGYSSLDKTNLSFGINEKNFLGTGRRASASVAFSDKNSNFNVGITEPYFMERDLTGRFDVFNSETKSDSTITEKVGTSFGVGFSAANDIYHRVTYEINQAKSSTSSTTATSITGEDNKTLLSSSVNYVLTKDTRDNRFDPTEGYNLELNETVAGLGGDVKYLRTKISGGIYQPFLFKAVVLGLSGQAGYVTALGGKQVTQSQRFFLGGRSVRGFESNGIGPRDTGSSDTVGGNQMFSGSVDIVSSLGLDKDSGIRWTMFSDVGSLWGTDYPSGVTAPEASDMRASIGLGIYWDTAIGPLTFSWAKPLSKMTHDRTKSFQFNIGTRL